MIANGTVNGRALFPIRFHHFVTESREGLVCLNEDCAGSPEISDRTDRWWSKLFLQHTKNCPHCQSCVYPLVICRKCGFAYLEAWRRPDAICASEKDELDVRSFRFLFRPVFGLSYTKEELEARKRALCLTCGQWFESAETEGGKSAQLAHPTRCQMSHIIEMLEWSAEKADYEMSECAVCEQNWYANREVMTAPTISPFVAATISIEDLISHVPAGRHSSKLISFSDTRQQAAKLARNLQRTNRDYVFRQLVFQLLATSQRPLNTIELFHEFYKEVRSDDRKRQLLIDSPDLIHDDLALEQNLADMIYRELTSAYHTLEALGMVRIDYGVQMRALATGLSLPGFWRNTLAGAAKADIFRLILDWGFRFRHCVASAVTKLPFRPATLQRWKIFVKRVPGPKFANKGQLEAVLFLEAAALRNPLFNFMSRLQGRKGKQLSEKSLDKGDFNELIQVVWQTFFSNRDMLTVGRASTETNREFLVTRPSEPEFGTLQLNLNSIIWAAIQPTEMGFRCNVCGRLANYSVAGTCPVRRCQGTLEEISQSDIERRFSPTRHYRRLVRERELRPLRVEEHTAEIANAKRLEIERRFKGNDQRIRRCYLRIDSF